MKNVRNLRAAALAAALVLAAAVPFLIAASSGGSLISYASGQCYQGAGSQGPWAEVKQGDQVAEGSYVKTEAGSRIEITMADGSVLRLGDSTLFLLETAKAKKDKGMSFSVILGKAWAKVKTVTGGQKFEVKTKTAVAGVRGTVFSVLAQQDAGTVVKVFEGLVAVNNKPAREGAEGAKAAVDGAKKTERVEVAGPKEVSKKAWEEMIAKAMTMIKVASNGEMTEPLAFELEVEKKDDWVAWNMERDAKLKAQ